MMNPTLYKILYWLPRILTTVTALALFVVWLVNSQMLSGIAFANRYNFYNAFINPDFYVIVILVLSAIALLTLFSWQAWLRPLLGGVGLILIAFRLYYLSHTPDYPSMLSILPLILILTGAVVVLLSFFAKNPKPNERK